VEGLTQLRFEARRPGVVLVLLGYLALLAVGELAVTFVNPLFVFPFHGGLILLAGTHLAILERRPADERPSPALVGLLLAFIVAPLIRIISLTLPLAQIEAPYRYLFAGVPMTIGALLVARATGLRWRDVGIVWRATGWQIAVVVASLALGFVEYAILRPEPLGPLPWTAAGFLPALSVGLFTGFPEELIFRGIMQTAARPVLGRWNWVYVSAIFAVLHIGYKSFIDFVFVFAVGLFYGWVFERTRSIIGVSVGHGLANVVLFFVAPSVIGAGSLRALTVGDELMAVTLALGATAAVAVTWFLGRGRLARGARRTSRIKGQATRRGEPGLMPLGPTRAAVVVDPGARAPDPSGDVLPAVPLLLSATAEDEFATTGRRIQETKAAGIVRLRSENTLHDVAVQAGTTFSTSTGIEFATTSDVLIPRASFQSGPSVVGVPVEAVNAGPEGNAEAGAVVVVPPDLEEILISASNAEAMTGGERVEMSFVTEQDYERALGAVRQKLELELAGQLEEEARQSDLTLFPTTVRWAESSVAPGREIIGEPAESFRLVMRQMATVTAVDEKEVADNVAARLEADIAQGYELIPGSIHVRLSEPAIDGEAVAYDVDALGEQRLADESAPPRSTPHSRTLWFIALIASVATLSLVVAASAERRSRHTGISRPGM
jgi:membrane protease YdiL (CAAX protease family)